MEKNVVRLNEKQLHTLIQESVKKVLKEIAGTDEISSDLISRASQKFHQKYGGTGFPGPDAKDFPKDEHGNLLYPKDMKPLADHYRNFSKAYNNAKTEELLSDPLAAKAQELYDGGVDWDTEIDDRDGGGAFGSVYGEVEDEDGGVWKFYGDASFEWEGSWEVSELNDIEFEAPNGQTGMVPRP